MIRRVNQLPRAELRSYRRGVGTRHTNSADKALNAQTLRHPSHTNANSLPVLQTPSQIPLHRRLAVFAVLGVHGSNTQRVRLQPEIRMRRVDAQTPYVLRKTVYLHIALLTRRVARRLAPTGCGGTAAADERAYVGRISSRHAQRTGFLGSSFPRSYPARRSSALLSTE